MGVTARRALSRSGGVLGTRTYSQALTGDLGCGQTSNPPKESVTRVTSSLGHESTHYFSVALNNSGAWQLEEYGLPLTHSDGASGTAGYLSTEVRSGGTLLRSTRLRYEWDAPNQEELDQRPVYQRTVYHDDGGRWADVTSSDFDGLGHYRRQTTGGSFDAGNFLETMTTFNPGVGTYAHQAVTIPAGQFPSTAAPWILGTFDERTVSDGVETAKEQFCFEAGTGFLLRHRTLAGSSPLSYDLLQVYTRTGQGFLQDEKDYGGDLQAVSLAGDLCTLTPPGSTVYHLRHSYSYRVRAKTEYLQAGGAPMPAPVLDLTIDQRSGLPAIERSPAGIATSFDYDALGRPRAS